MKIRELQFHDIPECCDIVEEHWGKDAGKRASQQLGSARYYHEAKFYVVLDDEKVVGFAGYRPSWVIKNAYEFVWVAVARSHQGRGIGHWLTSRRLSDVRELGASLVTLMTRSPLFFEQFGFETVDTHDGWCLMRLYHNAPEIA